MAAEGEDYARRSERIKHLLSSYYGNAPPEPGTPGTPGAAAGAAPPRARAAADGAAPPAAAPPAGRAPGGGGPGLDAPGFNPERHVSALTRSLGVAGLLSEHRGLARSIKHLDSDMQQLVYENYNKFIAATDTIRDMKANVDAMGDDMDRLAANMDAVAEKSAAVNAKLLKRRQHIEELSRVQGLLSALQAVFDLPARMKAALAEDALGAAVGFYAEALPLLRQHGHRGAFRGIAADADAAARDVSAALKRRLAERKGEPEQAVLLLRQLGEGDDGLQERYLAGRGERLRRILADAALAADAMAAAAASPGPRAGGAPPPGLDGPEGWGFGPDGTPPSLARFVTALDERLINTLQETAVNVTTIFLQDDGGPSRRKPLLALAKEVVGQYFRLVRRVVGDGAMAAVASAARLDLAGGDRDFSPSAPSLTFGQGWGADVVVQAMSAVTTDVGLLHGALPELSLRDWAAAATEQAVRGHVAAAFGALEERVASGLRIAAAQLAAPGAEPGQVLAPACAYLSEVVHRGVTALLKGLRAYEHHGRLLGSLQDQLPDAVQGQLAALFQSLARSFLAVAKVKGAGIGGAGASSSAGGGDGERPAQEAAGAEGQDGGAADEAPQTGLVLLLAKLCAVMRSTTVPAIVEQLAAAPLGRQGFSGGDVPPAFVGGDVARRLGATSDLLLGAYVDLHGRGLALLVERSVCGTDWLAAPPPRGPRPVCDDLLERVARADAELGRLLEPPGGPAPGAWPGAGGTHHARGGSVGDALESGAVERGVAKLFRGKAALGGSGLVLGRSSLLGAVAAVGLKALVEFVRLQTLACAGLQQLQVDAHYLRPRLLALLDRPDAEAVAALLDDVVAAAAERCTEPPRQPKQRAAGRRRPPPRRSRRAPATMSGKAIRRRAKLAERANQGNLHKAARGKGGATASLPLPAAPTPDDYVEKLPASLRRVMALRAAAEAGASSKRRKLEQPAGAGQRQQPPQQQQQSQKQQQPSQEQQQQEQQQQQQQQEQQEQQRQQQKQRGRGAAADGGDSSADEDERPSGGPAAVRKGGVGAPAKQQPAPAVLWEQPKKLKARKKEYLNAKRMKKKAGKARKPGGEQEQPADRPAFGETVHAPLTVQLKSKHWDKLAAAKAAAQQAQRPAKRGKHVAAPKRAAKQQDPALAELRAVAIEGYRAGRDQPREGGATLGSLKALVS
ncbi:VPS51 [Scenedesmus sp. PABB004]|nr:VPS51 [Scenedesmus sp. PABB004]